MPGPGEPGNDTWSGDSWRTGGAPTWLTGVYDPDLDLIYWGTGNPAPDWNGDLRLGDNLYSSSVLALDGKTGKIVWHFQFTPHDVWDWDAIQVPVLAEVEVSGEPMKAMLWANRNAFDGEAIYYQRDDEYVEGSNFLGGGMRMAKPTEHYQSAIRAVEAVTGEVRWEFPITPRTRSGVLATAGGLVWSASVDGYFFALDEETGEPLWRISLGAAPHASPMTYAVGGEQRVVVAMGNVVFVFGLADE